MNLADALVASQGHTRLRLGDLDRAAGIVHILREDEAIDSVPS